MHTDILLYVGLFYLPVVHELWRLDAESLCVNTRETEQHYNTIPMGVHIHNHVSRCVYVLTVANCDEDISLSPLKRPRSTST